MTEKEETVQQAAGSDTCPPETGSVTDSAELTAVIEEKDRLLADWNDRYMRLQADFDNFRRRTRQEKEELSAVVTEDLVFRLLPVIDNFDRALAAGQSQDAAGIRSGIEMIYRQLQAVLEKLEVKLIESVGTQFDPKLHEAVMRVEDEAQPDGMIIQELQKGYMVKEKIIRPSMVKVVGH
ncbi:nucleotide exchange factor GrpE [Acetonema longum]|uniref:Protein GrpE n=1 Tax=Acetonema longum DSM 6540 TaxID=1009370 RepID=F7NKW2_9FIRM|nr:nucleotide exchange factor GrpE [Acetonema longum]EGO63305.1 co-chaperone grpe [Acetonema longum DSM 6540]